MVTKPIIIFDTSGLNQLADDPESGCLEAGLKSGFFIRLTDTNLEEIVATKDGSRREHLLQLCRRLVAAGDCVYPYNRIVRELVTAHHQNPTSFVWTTIDVTFSVGTKELFRQEITTDELAKQQRTCAREQIREFDGVFDGPRTRLDDVFKQNITERPTSIPELVARLQGPSETYWNVGKSFYEHFAIIQPDDDTVRRFMDSCPPFCAMVLAICIAYYGRCIRDKQTPESYKAGAFDLYSSVYLPYCHQFITADQRQLNALREVAAVGNIGVDVLPYENFRNRLMLGYRRPPLASNG